MNDLRIACPQLRKNPCFTAVAVLSLAVGIGANTAVFSLLDAVLWRSLPVRDPQNLRVLYWSGARPKEYSFPGDEGWFGPNGLTLGEFSHPLYRAFRDEAKGIAQVFAFAPTDALTVVARGEATTAKGLLVSGNFFAGYGADARLGRSITPEDEQPGVLPVVVITHRAWERYFGSDPLAIGQPVRLNATSFTLIGVLPRRFAGPLAGDAADFYVPLTFQPQLARDWPLASRDHYWLQVMLRLPPGATDARARAALEVVLQRAQADLQESTAAPPRLLLRDGWRGPEIRRAKLADPLQTLERIVALVLLIACVNLAGLLLARNAARQHELAVRAALGARRWRLVRQCLTESLVLTLAGASLGFCLAYWGQAALARLLPQLSDGVQFDARLSLRLLAFTLVVAAVAALVSGALPAVAAARVAPVAGLQSARVLGRPRLRLGRLLVVGQIALSLSLVAGTGLMVRTVVNLHRINLGFDAEHLHLFNVNAAQAGHPEPQLPTFYDDLRERLAAIPGVRETAYSDQGHIGAGCWNRAVEVAGRADRPDCSGCLLVSDSFFETLRIPLLSGRAFTPADGPAAPRVAVVNRAFVETFLSGHDALGRRFRSGGREYQVVGVCANARYVEARHPLQPMMYLPYRQAPVGEVWFELQSMLPSPALAPAIRQIVARADPNLPLAALATQQGLSNRRMAEERLFAWLGGTLAGLAVALSCLGIYGLMAYDVRRRTGEIGIRMALGAHRGDVARPILREAALLAVAGAALGLPIALAAVRIVRHLLYNVHPFDPLVLGAAAVLLVLMATLAAWLPARRAAQVEPMVALRHE